MGPQSFILTCCILHANHNTQDKQALKLLPASVFRRHRHIPAHQGWVRLGPVTMSPTRPPLFLLIDQGGHASRALIYDQQGRLLSQAHEPLTPEGDEDRLEYDAEDLWLSVRNAVARAVHALGREKTRLSAAALATQRSNIACWDRATGAPLAPVIAWQDRRAAGRIDGLSDEEKRRIHHLTGLPPSPHYGASKMRWCLDHLPAVAAALDKGRLAMGPMASYLAQRLTTAPLPLADPVNASRTQLWDLCARDWSPQLLRLFGIPASVLPRCVASRHDFGDLQAGGRGVPLTLLTGDQSAALFAGGWPDPATAYLTLGTGAFVLRPTGSVARKQPKLLASIVHDDGEEILYALEGTINGAGSALRWYEAQGNGPVDYPALERLLAEDNAPPLFLNGIGGLGTPFLGARLDSRFVGRGDPGQCLVAIVESIMFLLQLNLEHMNEILHRPPSRIAAGGGLSRLNGLCQGLADLTGLPVDRSQAHETTALGLLRLLSPTPLRDPPRERFLPRPRPALAQRYERWKTLLYDALRTSE